MTDESFLSGYVRLCSETEAPPIFGLWCGVAAVSAALGRNSFLQFGQFPIYPNFYIIIVASSGLYRKSSSIEVASTLLKSIQPPPKLLSQKLTPEALIQAIRTVDTDNPLTFMRESGTGYVIADEFQVFLNRKSYEAGLASILIQMFDCKDSIAYQTVGRGVEEVNNACLGILGGSTIDWLKSGIPEDAVGGGLTSRMIFVYYDGPVRDVPWPEFSDEQERLKQRLILQLQSISQISGEFSLEPDARALYDEEYIRFRNVTGKDLFFDPNLRGYASRRHMHILKLSMIISASESPTRQVSYNHFLAALEAVKQCEKSLHQIISQITTTSAGTTLDLVMRVFHKQEKTTRTELQRAVAHRLNKQDLDKILDTLMSAGMIRMIVSGNATTYIIVKD